MTEEARPGPGSRWRLPVLLGGVGLVAVIAAMSLLSGGEDELCRPVRYPELVRHLEAHGTVRARSSLSHFSPLPGEAAKVLELAEEGRLVKAGEVIARLDDFALAERLRTQRLEDTRLRAELEAERVQAEVGRDRSRREEERLALALVDARRSAEAYPETQAPLRELELANALQSAENEHLEWTRKSEDLQELLDRGYASSGELERASRETAAAAARQEEAARRLAMFQEVERDREAASLEQRVRELRDELAGNRSGREAEERLHRSRLRTLEARLAESEARLGELARQVEGCTVRAGGDGIVVHGLVQDREAGLRPVRVGDLVWSNVVLIQVTDLGLVDLEVSIPEEQMHSLEVGQSAWIWMAAEPLTALEGTVRSLGTMTRRAIQVRIGLAEPPGWIRPGMTGRARIAVARYEDAQVVPFSAVELEGDRARVLVQRLWGLRPVEVEVLGVVDQGVVVGEGVSPSDRILRQVALR